jgi:hypothetical protein
VGVVHSGKNARSISIIEAVVLSPAVREQLQFDGCARGFAICDQKIDSTHFFSSKHSFRAGSWSSKVVSANIHSTLRSVGLERLFFGVCGNSVVDAAMRLSTDSATRLDVVVQSVSDRSLLLADDFHCLLLSESFAINSKTGIYDFHLRFVICLASPHSMKDSAIAPFGEDFVLCCITGAL